MTNTGTAIISGAALVNALEVSDKKKIDRGKGCFQRAGAAGMACARLYEKLGVRHRIHFICRHKRESFSKAGQKA